MNRRSITTSLGDAQPANRNFEINGTFEMKETAQWPC